MKLNKKAISPVVATSLLIVVVVVALVGFQNWQTSYQSGLQADVEQRSQGAAGSVNVEFVSKDGILYVTNSYSTNQTINSIKVGDLDCPINQNLTPGVNNISISSCLESAGTNEVMIVTDSGVITETLFVDEEVISSASSIDCSSLGIGGEWTTVPADNYFFENDFCVMKHEARNVSNVATSEPLMLPWNYNNYTEAYDNCANLGPDYHLITNREWMIIARNIEAVAANWNSSTVGVGVIYGGNLGINTGGTYDYNGGEYDNGSSRDTKARLYLDNGEEIWDFSGNMMEWVDANENGTTRTPGDACTVGSPVEYDECSYLSPFDNSNAADKRFEIGPAGNYNNSHGIGVLYDFHNGQEGTVFIRSGAPWGLNWGGIHFLELDYYITDDGDENGFRCSYNPNN